MKTLNIKSAILCLMLFLLGENSYAQFFLTPGQNQTITDGCWGFPSDYSWSWDCTDITNTADNENTQTFLIPLNVTCCKVKFSATGKCNGFGQNFQQTFNILPVIDPLPSVVYPGTLFQASTSAGGVSSAGTISNYPCSGGIGGLNCAADHGCPNATITWQVSGASLNGGGNGSCALITVPNNASVTSPIVIDANYNCNSAHALGPVSVNVALRDPYVSGPSSIGCGSATYTNNSTVTYTANYSNAAYVAGAAYWVWGYPPNMTPVGGVNGQTITFNVIGPGGGNVTVESFSSDGTVSSNVISYAVNICCIPVINDNTTLNSGNAGYLVEAGSTINSINDLQSTATATMHAGTEVRLLTGFNAVLGSQAHFYIAPCNSGYMRMMTSPSGDNQVLSEAQEISAGHADTPSSKNGKSKSNVSNGKSQTSFKVMPNPSSGLVNIDFIGNADLPLEVTVVDGFGNVIQKTGRITDVMLVMDLSNYPDGVYAIRVTYGNNVESKLVVKHAD